jgi:hypothetical protein
MDRSFFFRVLPTEKWIIRQFPSTDKVHRFRSVRILSVEAFLGNWAHLHDYFTAHLILRNANLAKNMSGSTYTLLNNNLNRKNNLNFTLFYKNHNYKCFN